MDDIVHRLARELANAIGATVADDAQVEACREKARAAGYDMRISLEAVVGFSSMESSDAATSAQEVSPAEAERAHPDECVDITANDRRFLRSLRISADEIDQKVE